MSVTEKSLIDAKSDANMDKIPLELSTFEEFSIAVLSGHDFCAPRGFVTLRSLFWIFSNQRYKKWNEKSHFYRRLVIIVVFGCYYYCLFNLQVRYVFVLEPKPFNLTKPRPRSVPMPEKVSTRQLSIKALIKELHFNLYLFQGWLVIVFNIYFHAIVALQMERVVKKLSYRGEEYSKIHTVPLGPKQTLTNIMNL